MSIPPTPPTAVAVRHVAFEDLGVLEPLLTDRGYRVQYLDSGVDDLAPAVDADLLVVLGGPIGVGDAAQYPLVTAEIDVLRRRLDATRPTLGICLGAQLVAAALGAGVASAGRLEIGYAPVTLTEAGRESVLAPLSGVPVLHWHGDQFDIPRGAASLATTPGFPHQAFAMGSHVLALQFHLETDHERIEQWLIGHAHELATAALDPRALRDDARRAGPRLAESARVVFGAWLDRLGS